MVVSVTMISSALLVLGLAGAAPISANLLTVDAMIRIAPATASCQSKDSECATAEEAVPHINAAYKKYGIIHPSVQAAVLSTMVFESGQFVYNKNHYPGRPGQGTKAMLMPNFVKLYAESLGLGTTGSPTDILAEVSGLDYTFGAAAWYITAQCPLSIRESMWGGSVGAYQYYVEQCLGATWDAGRAEYYQKALAELGSA